MMPTSYEPDLFPEVQDFVGAGCKRAFLLGLPRSGKTTALAQIAGAETGDVVWCGAGGSIPMLPPRVFLSCDGLAPWVEAIANNLSETTNRELVSETELMSLFIEEADAFFPGLGFDIFPSYLAYLKSESNEEILQASLAARFLRIPLPQLHDCFAAVTRAMQAQKSWSVWTAMSWLIAEARNHNLCLKHMGYAGVKLVCVDDMQLLSSLELRFLNTVVFSDPQARGRATVGQVQSLGLHEGRLGARLLHARLTEAGWTAHHLKSSRWLGGGHISALTSMNPDVGRVIASPADRSERLEVNVILHEDMEDCLERVTRDVSMSLQERMPAERMLIVSALPYYVADVADALAEISPLSLIGEGVGMRSAAIAIAHSVVRLFANGGDRLAKFRMLSLFLEPEDLNAARALLDSGSRSALDGFLEEAGALEAVAGFLEDGRASTHDLAAALRSTPLWPKGDAVTEQSLDRWIEWTQWAHLDRAPFSDPEWAPWLSGPPARGPANPDALTIVAGPVAISERYAEAHFIGFSGGIVPPPMHPKNTVEGGFAHCLTRVNGLITCHHVETIESPTGEEIKLYPSSYLRNVSPQQRPEGPTETTAPRARRRKRFTMRFR